MPVRRGTSPTASLVVACLSFFFDYSAVAVDYTAKEWLDFLTRVKKDATTAATALVKNGGEHEHGPLPIDLTSTVEFATLDVREQHEILARAQLLMAAYANSKHGEIRKRMHWTEATICQQWLDWFSATFPKLPDLTTKDGKLWFDRFVGMTEFKGNSLYECGLYADACGHYEDYAEEMKAQNYHVPTAWLETWADSLFAGKHSVWEADKIAKEIGRQREVQADAVGPWRKFSEALERLSANTDGWKRTSWGRRKRAVDGALQGIEKTQTSFEKRRPAPRVANQ